MLDIDISGSVPVSVPGDSAWRGVSGAAVFCGPWLVGVIASTVANYGPDRLSATLLEPCLNDAALLELLAEQGVDARLALADMPRALASPFRPLPFASAGWRQHSPALLVQPEHEVVSFAGREDELRELLAWSDNSELVSVRLLTGPAGQGKSRLAAEVCRARAADGWLTGTLTGLATPADLDQLLSTPAGLLIVIDWADSRTRELLDIVVRAPSAAAGPIRILLLARVAGSWWDSLPYRVGDSAGDAFVEALNVELGPVTSDLAVREQQFDTAVAAFARRLNRAPDDQRRPDLSDPIFDAILLIHLAALRCFEFGAGRPTSSLLPNDLVVHFLRREDVQYWEASAPLFLQGDNALAARRRAIAVATLTSAGTEQEARRAFGAVPDFGSSMDLTVVLGWLHRLYPGDAYLGALRPDLLAEALVAEVVVEHPELPRQLLAGSENPWATRVLTVLVDAARSRPMLTWILSDLLADRMEGLVAQARKAADASLGHALAVALGMGGSVELARRFEESAENRANSFALAEPAAISCQILLDSTTDPVLRARRLANLSSDLVELGRTTEALAASQEAVRTLTELTARGGEFRAELAVACHGLASLLQGSEDGLAAASSAVENLRTVIADGDAAKRSWLAAALSNRSACQLALGLIRDALDSARESTELCRLLAVEDPGEVPKRLINTSVRNPRVARVRSRVRRW